MWPNQQRQSTYQVKVCCRCTRVTIYREWNNRSPSFSKFCYSMCCADDIVRCTPQNGKIIITLQNGPNANATYELVKFSTKNPQQWRHLSKVSSSHYYSQISCSLPEAKVSVHQASYSLDQHASWTEMSEMISPTVPLGAVALLIHTQLQQAKLTEFYNK